MECATNDALLQLFKQGDASAFETVFRNYYRQLRTAAFLLLKDEQEAEDIVQQLFLELWNRELYKNVSTNLGAYLNRAIRNRCFNYLESKKRNAKAAENYLVEKQEITDTIPVQDEESPAILQNMLQQFPQQRLAALNLVYVQEKSYKEAASNMGITVNSLKTHLKLGLKALRTSLPAHQNQLLLN
jgi:RNA polymerase sigma-70 factor (family 1)